MSLEHHSIYGVLAFTLTRRNFSKKPAHDKYDGTTMMKKKKTTTKTTKNICDDCTSSHLIYLFPIKEFNPSQLLNLDVRKVIKNIMNVFSNSPDKNRGNTKRGSYLKRKG